MKHILSIIGLSLLGFALAFGQGGVGGKGGFGGKGGVGGGTTAGGGVTWTLVQGSAAAAHNFTCGAGACSTGTLTAVTAGDPEIILWAAFAADTGNPLTSNAITGDSSFVHCTNFPLQFAYIGGNFEIVDCYYKLSATGGATSFTITPTWDAGASGQTQDLQFIQPHRSTGTATYDNSQNNGGNNTCTGNLCAGPSMTLTGTNDFCVQFGAFASHAPTAISGGYSNPATFDSSNVFGGFAGNINVTSYSIPNWSATSTPPDGVADGALCLK